MYSARKSRFSAVTRIVSTLVSFTLVTTYILAAPLQARAEDIRAAKVALDAANARARYSAPVTKPRLIPPPKSLKQNLTPLNPAQIAQMRLNVGANARVQNSVTMLDSIGNLKQKAPTNDDLNRSAKKLTGPNKAKLAAAYLHLMHGELYLARDQHPDSALTEFHAAERLASERTGFSAGSKRHRAKAEVSSSSIAATAARAIRDTASLDVGYALYYGGQYRPAADHLGNLLQTKRPLIGFARKDAALFLRHAKACTGYHAEREKAGIVEPTRIAPLCGIEAIAAWLRANGRPFTKNNVRPLCRVTGSSVESCCARHLA